MLQLRRISVITVIVTCILQAQGADKYNDENRPYEFGFNIEGEQHRHEKKGEDGLIEGEFGFITADGVYHVTVYATDENGNFKILSMKNIRVRPYPTAPEKKALDFPPSENKPLTQGPNDVSIELPARSCSHCSIPTTTKEPELTDLAVVSVDDPAYNQQQYPENYPQYPPEYYPEQPQDQPQDQPQFQPQDYPQEALQPGERNPKQYENVPAEVPDKPVLISAQMQIVDKDTDINYRAPGEQEGLPNGLEKQDMQLLLYTFNYTVGFHGHYEEGYTNGYKKGYYFVTGRNGVRTRVDYEADDKGFRPKISQEVLDLLSDDVPKPETEKDARFGLKGYEFKWLYYPVDSKRR